MRFSGRRSLGLVLFGGAIDLLPRQIGRLKRNHLLLEPHRLPPLLHCVRKKTRRNGSGGAT